MEHTFLKQQKELKELKVDIGNVTNPKMSYKGNLTKGKHIWTKIYRGKWLLMKGCKKF
jgi:hypothetical protein